MAPPVGSLVVRIGSDIRGLLTGFGKGKDTVTGFGEAATRVGKRIAKLTLATTAAATAIGVLLARQGLKSVDAMAKFARVIGVSTEALAGLQLAAKETADFTDTQFNLAFQRMTRRIAEAANGTGEAQDAIKQLGLDARELAAAGPDKAFLQIADAMQGVNDESERLRLGFKLFDSEGARLVNTLALGSAEIERFGKRAAALGLTFSEFDAKQVEAANDAMGRIALVIEGVARTLAIELSPLILEISERITNAAEESKGFGRAIESSVASSIRFVGRLINGFREFQIQLLRIDLAAKDLRRRGLGLFVSPSELQTALRDVERAAESLAAFQNLPPFDADAFIEQVRAKAEAAAKAADIVTSGRDVGDPLGTLEGGGEDPALEALREKIAARLEIIREGLLTERELEQEAFQERLEMIRQGLEAELPLAEELHARREELEQQHQDRLTEIDEEAAEKRRRLEDQAQQQRIRNVASTFGAIGSLVGTLNRTLFEDNKSAAIAEAILNGIAGAIRTWNAYPYPWNIPLTAAHVAGTAAQIAAIQSSSFSSRSSGAVAAPSPTTPSDGGGGGGAGGGGGGGAGSQSVNISLVGDTFGRTQVRDLIEEINDAVADGARLRVV